MFTNFCKKQRCGAHPDIKGTEFLGTMRNGNGNVDVKAT